MGIKRGDLIRWVVDWGIYAVSDNGEAYGEYPTYCYGIVMEVSAKDPDAVVVYAFNTDHEWSILHLIHDDFEIISGD